MLETSITPMYKGEESYTKIIEFMKKKDFMFGLLKRFSNKKTGKVNQLDIIFVNKNV